MISIANSFAIDSLNDPFQQKVKQINSFIDYVHLDDAKSEQSLDYERDRLLDYKSYISDEIYRLELSLNKLDRLLEFVDQRYQNNKYSEFINDSVKTNEKFNTRLKDYTKLRVVILNDLILAKDTDINIEYALDEISTLRSYLRNEFKFAQSTVLWESKSWVHAYKTISNNFVSLALGIIIIMVTALLFVFFRKICSIDGILLKIKVKR